MQYLLVPKRIDHIFAKYLVRNTAAYAVANTLSVVG
jgi:hypothetical protein